MHLHASFTQIAEKQLRTLNSRPSLLVQPHWKRSNAPIWWMKSQYALCVVAVYLPRHREFVGSKWDKKIHAFICLRVSSRQSCERVQTVTARWNLCTEQSGLVATKIEHDIPTHPITYNTSYVENLAAIIRHENVWVLCDSLWVLGWPCWPQIRDCGLNG